MRSIKLWITRIHLWAGLLLGLQVLVWMSSGVIMSWFHIKQVRGEHNIAQRPEQTLDTHTTYFDPARLADMSGAKGAKRITLRHLLDRPVYDVDTAEGRRLFDAVTGDRLDPLPEEMARALAARDFSGEGSIASAGLLKERTTEYRGELPVWRVQFTDPGNTRIYVSAATGEVTARRNAIWRLYDFFWMLHIMDYDERTDFNNPLIKTASATGLVFALSGLVLVILRLGAGRYMMDLRRLSRTGRSTFFRFNLRKSLRRRGRPR